MILPASHRLREGKESGGEWRGGLEGGSAIHMCRTGLHLYNCTISHSYNVHVHVHVHLYMYMQV